MLFNPLLDSNLLRVSLELCYLVIQGNFQSDTESVPAEKQTFNALSNQMNAQQYKTGIAKSYYLSIFSIAIIFLLLPATICGNCSSETLRGGTFNAVWTAFLRRILVVKSKEGGISWFCSTECLTSSSRATFHASPSLRQIPWPNRTSICPSARKAS